MSTIIDEANFNYDTKMRTWMAKKTNDNQTDTINFNYETYEKKMMCIREKDNAQTY